jgi:transcriptional regulator with XRE-family HTH domain
MAFYDDLLKNVKEIARDQYRNPSRMADELGFSQSQLSKLLSGKSMPRLDFIGELIDSLGGRLVFPERQQNLQNKDDELSLGLMQGVHTDDYIAVPVLGLPAVAAPLPFAQETVEDWIMVWRHHDATRFRDHLAAVRLPVEDKAMYPIFSAGDLLLVDREDCTPDTAGKIMLVRTPDGRSMIRRVAVHSRGSETEFVFYTEDSKNYPPEVYNLRTHYEGDVKQALAGSVVWAWSDVRGK